MSTANEFLLERRIALSNLDMAWARKYMPGASDDAVRLIALHKARYEALDISRELRYSSGEWLRERGLGRFGGLDLLPEDILPGDPGEVEILAGRAWP